MSRRINPFSRFLALCAFCAKLNGIEIQEAASGALSRATAINFAPSLEMAEVADFVLAPAFELTETFLSASESRESLLQADAILSFSARGSYPKTLLFARYWIASNHYAFAVRWAEPHGRVVNFPVYPPGLTITSSAKAFHIGHSVMKEWNHVFIRPIKNREYFTNLFGDYPITNVRFAESEALLLRVGKLADLAADGLGTTNSATQFLFKIPFDAIGGGAPMNIALKSRSEFASHFVISDLGGIVLQEITFTLNDSLGNRSKSIYYPENEGYGLLPGKALVRRNGREVHFEPKVPIKIREGGRSFTTHYKIAMIGTNLLHMPTELLYSDAATKRTLCSARLSNFQVFAMEPLDIIDAAKSFASFSEKDQRYREFLVKYWRKPATDIPLSDVTELHALSRHYSSDASTSDIASNLKSLNIQIEIDRMLGRSEEVLRKFDEYLKFLRTSRLDDMILTGGYNIVETALLWSRFSEADRLMEKWITTVVSFCDPDQILGFARRGLDSGHLWPIACLAETYLTAGKNALDRKELQLLRSTALNRILAIQKNSHAFKGSVSELHARWALQTYTEEEMHRLANAPEVSPSVKR